MIDDALVVGPHWLYVHPDWYTSHSKLGLEELTDNELYPSSFQLTMSSMFVYPSARAAVLVSLISSPNPNSISDTVQRIFAPGSWLSNVLVYLAILRLTVMLVVLSNDGLDARNSDFKLAYMATKAKCSRVDLRGDDLFYNSIIWCRESLGFKTPLGPTTNLRQRCLLKVLLASKVQMQ